MKHAVLSASGMYRWAKCPGVIKLVQALTDAGVIDPNRSSAYAIEGTGAHECGERCLRTGAQPASFIDKYMNTEAVPVLVTQEMADAVQVYVDYVRSISVVKGDTLFFIEQTFDLSTFYPGLFGTADCVAYHIPTSTLYVIDFKYGQGVAVEAVNNSQLRYYGLGALVRMREMKLAYPMPTTVKLVIVQPRAPHAAGPIREETIQSARLLMWLDDLIEAAKATEAADAPLVPGEHCRFCPAAARCPKLYENSLDAARMAFAPVAKPTLHDVTAPTPVRELSDEQLRRALMAAQLIEPWLKELHAHAYELLLHGVDVPGYKLVLKRATRSWAMDEVITKPELLKLGLNEEEIYEPRTLRSPAQMEKLLPRSRYAELNPLVAKVSSGLTLAPVDDPRPAVKQALPFEAIKEGA